MSSRADVEGALRETVAREGVHVVHVWAPWCPNAVAELAPVWAEAPARHPDASFTFAAVWADGDDGADLLRQHGVPDAVARLVVPGPEAREGRAADDAPRPPGHVGPDDVGVQPGRASGNRLQLR